MSMSKKFNARRCQILRPFLEHEIERRKIAKQLALNPIEFADENHPELIDSLDQIYEGEQQRVWEAWRKKEFKQILKCVRKEKKLIAKLKQAQQEWVGKLQEEQEVAIQQTVAGNESENENENKTAIPPPGSKERPTTPKKQCLSAWPEERQGPVCNYRLISPAPFQEHDNSRSSNLMGSTDNSSPVQPEEKFTAHGVFDGELTDEEARVVEERLQRARHNAEKMSNRAKKERRRRATFDVLGFGFSRRDRTPKKVGYSPRCRNHPENRTRLRRLDPDPDASDDSSDNKGTRKFIQRVQRVRMEETQMERNQSLKFQKDSDLFKTTASVLRASPPIPEKAVPQVAATEMATDSSVEMQGIYQVAAKDEISSDDTILESPVAEDPVAEDPVAEKQPSGEQLSSSPQECPMRPVRAIQNDKKCRSRKRRKFLGRKKQGKKSQLS